MSVVSLEPTSKASAALVTALIGDALGVPYEFSRAADIPSLAKIEMAPPWDFYRSHRGTPTGTWSDDGALMLALLDSLLAEPTFDALDYSQRMQAWFFNGTYTPDGRVFDVGNQTRVALEALQRGGPILNPELLSVSNNGNGSLMRVLPVAFLPYAPDEIVRIARAQSVPTHPHIRSQLCCALYALLVRELLHGTAPVLALVSAGAAVQKSLGGDATTLARESAEFDLIFMHHKPLKGSGYVVDSLWSAWRAFATTDTTEGCLKAAIAMGDDTDTTACLAGGLAGAYYGPSGIPTRWLEALKGGEVLAPFVAKTNDWQPTVL